MALQQTTVIDKIEIVENGTLQVRQRTDIFDDANPSAILASNYQRNSLAPASDLAGQEPKVVAIANATWTPEVIASYQAEQAKNALPISLV
jgi:hypothetical protein